MGNRTASRLGGSGTVRLGALPLLSLRGGHLFLAASYLIPLIVWLACASTWVATRSTGSTPADRPRWRLRTWEAAGRVGMRSYRPVGRLLRFLLLLPAAGGRDRGRDPGAAVDDVGGVGPAPLLVAARRGGVAPSFLYRARHGRNFEVAARSAGEADIFGLNVSEMLLPVYQHRIEYLAKLRNDSSRRPVAPPGRRRPSRSAPWRRSASCGSSAGSCGGGGAGPSGVKTASPT